MKNCFFSFYLFEQHLYEIGMKNCPLSFSTTLIIFGHRREEGEATLDARVVRDLKLELCLLDTN